MIIFLYIYFIFNLLAAIILYLLSFGSELTDYIINKLRGESNEHLVSMVKRSIKRNIIGIVIILILMILFL